MAIKIEFGQNHNLGSPKTSNLLQAITATHSFTLHFYTNNFIRTRGSVFLKI